MSGYFLQPAETVGSLPLTQHAPRPPTCRAFHAGTVIDRRLYIFGGHVYVKQQHKLHQFNDLWCLNTVRVPLTRFSACLSLHAIHSLPRCTPPSQPCYSVYADRSIGTCTNTSSTHELYTCAYKYTTTVHRNSIPPPAAQTTLCCAAYNIASFAPLSP